MRGLGHLAGSVAIAGLLGLGGAVNAAAAGQVAIGSGEPGSPYHKLGRAICRLIDSGSAEHGLTCTALATPGGLFNLANVRGGAIEFGLVPSDLHYYAVAHAGPFEYVDETYDNLRSLFSLYAEYFTLVARRNAGIAALDDLKGRRVNRGPWGSTERGFIDALVAAKGWSTDDFLTAEELPVSQQSLSLCQDRLDAIVYAAAHPSRDVAQVLRLCDGVLIGVAGDELAAIQARKPFYVAGQIPGESYPEAEGPVRTFGIKVTLVSSAETDAETVYAVVKAVFEDLGRLKRSIPPLAPVEAGEMMVDGLAAPLHEGARRYFQEAGMM